MMRRVLLGLIVALLVGVVVVGQQVWAAFMGQPPWKTHLQLAALPMTPWTRMPTPPSLELKLPLGFHERGVDAARQDERQTHLPFGFADYRTGHPLGGSTRHQPLQVDVVVVQDDLDRLRAGFFNSAAFVAIGGAPPDRMERLPGDVVLEHYDRTGNEGGALRALVIVDAVRALRLEVVDQLQHFDEVGLRAFGLQVHASVVLPPSSPPK